MKLIIQIPCLNEEGALPRTLGDLPREVPGFAAALAYYDALRAERLPAALTQGQRDFFGAHTYERVDKPGTFHTEWSPISR